MAPVRLVNKPILRCEFCNRKTRLCTCVLCNEYLVRLCCAGVEQGVTECVCTSCFVNVPRAWYKSSHIVRRGQPRADGQNRSLTGRIRERIDDLEALLDLVSELECLMDRLR